MAERKLLFFLSFLSLGRVAQFGITNTFTTQSFQYGSYSTKSYTSSVTTRLSMSTTSTLIKYMPTLVKENKTWEEALQYCITYHTYLACPTLDIQLLLDEIEATQSQTVSVWMGVQFLDGKWIWVKGELVTSLVSLPSCPVQGYRCGARNTRSNVWENADCQKKLNFICY